MDRLHRPGLEWYRPSALYAPWAGRRSRSRLAYESGMGKQVCGQSLSTNVSHISGAIWCPCIFLMLSIVCKGGSRCCRRQSICPSFFQSTSKKPQTPHDPLPSPLNPGPAILYGKRGPFKRPLGSVSRAVSISRPREGPFPSRPPSR